MSKTMSTHSSYNRLLTGGAKIISFLFHPIFMPVYIMIWLMNAEPLLFLTLDDREKYFILAHIIVFPCLFPAFATFLLYKLNFIDSFFLRTQKERIIPYIISMIFFFWSYYLFKNKPEWPQLFTQLFLGIFICVSLAVVLNNFYKISMHAMGVAGALAFVSVLMFKGLLGSVLTVFIFVLLCGVVCTARLVLQSHRPFEIYAGVVCGMLSQLIAMAFVPL